MRQNYDHRPEKMCHSINHELSTIRRERGDMRKRISYADQMSLEEIRIFLWFEFYKLALADPLYREAIKKSRDHYLDWGKVRPTDGFAPWWKKNWMLFGHGVFEDRKQPVREWLFITVPLNQTETSAVAAFRELFRVRQAQLAKDQGSIRRTKAGRGTGIPHGLYDFTSGTEFRVGPSLDALTIYRHFLAGRRGSPPINRTFVERVKRYYGKRGWNLPSSLQGAADDPSTLRSLRRYVKRAQELIRAAAEGDFPGKSIVNSRG